jgi:hypothetical protein
VKPGEEIEFDSLSFLLNDSNQREQPKHKEDVRRRKVIREGGEGRRNSRTNSVN